MTAGVTERGIGLLGSTVVIVAFPVARSNVVNFADEKNFPSERFPAIAATLRACEL